MLFNSVCPIFNVYFSPSLPFYGLLFGGFASPHFVNVFSLFGVYRLMYWLTDLYVTPLQLSLEL